MGERIIAEEPLREQEGFQGGARAWEFRAEHEDQHGDRKIALKIVELPGEPPCEAFECFGKYGERLGALKADNLEEKEDAANLFDYFEEHRYSADFVFDAFEYDPNVDRRNNIINGVLDFYDDEDYESDPLPDLYDWDEDGNMIKVDLPEELQKSQMYPLFGHNSFEEKGWENVEVKPGLKMTRTDAIERVKARISPHGKGRTTDGPHRDFLDLVMTYEVNGDEDAEVDKALLEKLGVNEGTLHEAVMEYIDDPYSDKYERVIVDQNMFQYKYEEIAQDLPLDLCLICHPAGALPILSDKHLREIATTLAAPSSFKYSDYLEDSYRRLDDGDLGKEASFYVLNVTANHMLVAHADTVKNMDYLDELMHNFRAEYPNEKELTGHPYFYDAKTHELTLDGGILKESCVGPQKEADQQAQTQENPAPRRRGR